MSCKCFNEKPSFKQTDDFTAKLTGSQCKCSARFTVTENKSKFVLDTKDKEKVEKYKIDGYFDTSSESPKCDYVFTYALTKDEENIVTNNNISMNIACKVKQEEKNKEERLRYIFVELKGSDVKHAVLQIQTTVELFYQEGKLKNNQAIGAIVSTKVPSNNSSYRDAKLRAERTLKNKIPKFRIEQKNLTMTYNPDKDKVS